MNYLKGYLIFILLVSSFLTFSQETILLKGYVIDDQNILPGVSVRVIGKETNTLSNVNGRFKIECVIGDTIVFENKRIKRYNIEKYTVKDGAPLIIKMEEVYLMDDLGRNSLGYYSPGIVIRQSIQLASSFTDNRTFLLGYNFYTQPLFFETQFIPIRNVISLGANLSFCKNSYYIFPNVGFELMNSYRAGNEFFLSLVVPKVKIGYWINDFQSGKHGVGYELEFNFLKSSYSAIHFSLAGSYANYLSTNGTFMVHLLFETYSPKNPIPKFIRKAITK